MEGLNANAVFFTPRKHAGHVRSASDPAPSSSTTTSSTWTCSSPSEDGVADPVDSVVGDIESDASSPLESKAAAPAHTTAHHPRGPAAQHLTNVLALGARAVVYGMPVINTTHHKLRCAQFLFPPEMCVFIGNLPASWDDGMLTRAVKYEFGKFGPCAVGVFRKVPSKPYAIVQYTDLNDATHAVLYGNGLWMERRLRVEWSARARS